MRTLGVDLSADPAKTGACAVDWDAGTVAFLDRPTHDEEIVASAVDADMVAIDVPLGWPDGFIEAVVAHRDGAGWPPVSTDSPADRIPLRYRRTDRDMQDHGARPLSVSSDLIGVAAMRGARLQHLLTSAGITVDRSGVTGRVIEAYPAAALRFWGLSSTKYKGRVNSEACRLLAGELTNRCGPLSVAASGCLDGCDDDGLDAFVCAVVARAALATPLRRALGTSTSLAGRAGFMSQRLSWLRSLERSRQVRHRPIAARNPSTKVATTTSSETESGRR